MSPRDDDFDVIGAVRTRLVAVVGGLVALGGLWYPLGRKRPVQVVDGTAVYTDEIVTGMLKGFHGDEPLLATGVVAAVVVALVRPRWRGSEWALAAVGGVLSLVAWTTATSYWAVDRYALDVGLPLLVAGALTLFALGVGGTVQRWLAGREPTEGPPTRTA